MFGKLRFKITAAAAGVACMVVAVVSAGFTIYGLFRLFTERVLASGLTAAVFLALAIGLLLVLHEEETRVTERPEYGVRQWAGLAGELLGAFAVGALGSSARRAPRDRR
jgi:EamA domain-containing membrane protein RarD